MGWGRRLQCLGEKGCRGSGGRRLGGAGRYRGKAGLGSGVEGPGPGLGKDDAPVRAKGPWGTRVGEGGGWGGVGWRGVGCSGWDEYGGWGWHLGYLNSLDI